MSNNPFWIDFSSLWDALEDLQNVYSEWLQSMGKVNEEIAKDMNPTHKVLINVKLSARVENHNYYIDSQLEFLADLNSILNSESHNLSSVLEWLNLDLSWEESNQVIEQLWKPRCVGMLNNFKINEIELHTDNWEISEGINKKANMLITLEDNKLHLSFESAFALPELQTKETLYYAIPSQEEMQKNVVLNLEDLNKWVDFEWQEKDKDNLKIKGHLEIKEID